jgi:hypothetical protein
MFNANVFDTKVIHYEAKLEWTLFMTPKSWHGSHFIEALSHELQPEKVFWLGCQLGEVHNSLGKFQSRSSHLNLGQRDCIP